MTAGALVLLALLGSVAAGLILYLLVRSEHDARERMDRADAEAAARRDTSERDER
jgi:cytochrome c-type biogenesis protein CcmH/NrfG